MTFNDNLYHFYVGLERYKINTGAIRHMINNLKKKVEGINQDNPISVFYQYKSYVSKDESKT
ncbi:MAG: hypothetical protein R3C61_03920 [Bacteroidia bacterium]